MSSIEMFYYNYLEGPGELQMEYDLRMLSLADTGFHLRFYRFMPACVSLGRLQKKSDFIHLPYPVVKRPTGGRAVLHYGDLVYSVAMREDYFGKKMSLIEFYNFIGNIFLKALLSLNIPAQIIYPHDKKVYFSRRNCFASFSQAEIAVAGKKIVGSAQYRKDGKILQHGSILVEDNFPLLQKIFPETLENTTTYLSKYLPSKYGYKNIAEQFLNTFKEELNPATVRNISIFLA